MFSLRTFSSFNAKVQGVVHYIVNKRFKMVFYAWKGGSSVAIALGFPGIVQEDVVPFLFYTSVYLFPFDQIFNSAQNIYTHTYRKAQMPCILNYFPKSRSSSSHFNFILTNRPFP